MRRGMSPKKPKKRKVMTKRMSPVKPPKNTSSGKPKPPDPNIKKFPFPRDSGERYLKTSPPKKTLTRPGPNRASKGGKWKKKR